MDKLYIVMYHYTRDLNNSRYPNIKGLDLKLFQQQISFFKEKYNIVTMEQVIDAAERHSALPKNAMLLTFDDGYIDNYTYAFPILEEQKIQGTFFVPGKTFVTHQLLDVNKIHYILACADMQSLLTDVYHYMDYCRGKEFDYASNDLLFQEYAIANRFDSKETVFVKKMLQTVLPEQLRNYISSELFQKYVGISEQQLAYELYMTEAQIRTMKRHGMFIGIHGYDHYWLGNLSGEQMRADITLALDALDEFIDRKHWVMCYPYGNYNQDVLDYIGSQGACLGVTTEVRRADLSKDDNLKLPRLDCNDFPPKSNNYAIR